MRRAFSKGYQVKLSTGFGHASRRQFVTYPSLYQRKYTKEHEWVLLSNGQSTIGVTDYAQKALGDVVYVEMPEIDQAVKRGDTIGAVESVKAASDIYAPVSGEVEEINDALVEKPSLINSSPEEKGWICKIKIGNEDDLADLMDAEAYNEHCKGEIKDK